MTEVPTVLRPDGRDRRPHLRTWRDGWRHLKLLLLYCPLWLFFIPGAAMLLIGVVVMLLLMGGPLHVGAAILDVHTLVYAAMLQIAGFQILSLGLFARGYATSHGLISARAPLRKFPMEWGIVFGCALLLCGIAGSVYALTLWSQKNFVYLNPIESLRVVIPSSLAITFGLQCVFMSFVIEVLRLKSSKQPADTRHLHPEA